MRICLLLLALALCLPAVRAGEIDAAPLWQVEERDGQVFRRGLGPLIEYSDAKDGQRLIAVRPFFSLFTDPTQPYRALDTLWPLLYSRRDYGEYAHIFCLLTALTMRIDTTPAGDKQTYLLPSYFHGKTEGEHYYALFPIAGHIRNFMSQDEIHFYLFPLYLTTRMGVSRGYHVLYPIFAKVDGEHGKKRRIFPLWGYSERFGISRNGFLLWPLFTYNVSLNPKLEGRSFMLFPFYGQTSFQHTERDIVQKGVTVLWPLFAYKRNQTGMMTNLPWPIIQYANGFAEEGSRKRYLWPLCGYSELGARQYRFFLWPIVQHVRQSKDNIESSRFYVLPFFWRYTDDYRDGRQGRHTRLWPLFSRERGPDGDIDIRTLDLWPQRESAVVERNLSPLWTLYRYKKSETEKRHDLLWGFWQHQRGESGVKHALFPFYSHKRSADGADRRTNLLLGLVGREKEGDKKKTRLLWLFKF